ncbi:NTMT1 [Bugula neritina]|uniref:Alpha N-terminal protein methyltransferase 1 n=1 Tax=Bugula neritina TaxID=10212 RepID=A0A7J7JFD6_BUGNE|nr:NTMT1 [Bugula neritina]
MEKHVELEHVDTKHKFYQDALSYWSNVPPTVDGMLGGFSYITTTDVNGSSKFLKTLMNSEKIGRCRALDCGAGIGRVTKNLLLPLFDTVDMLEVVGHLTDKHLAEFLKRCQMHLNENGIICIKDNVANTRSFDHDDSSMIRSLDEMKSVIAAAGLTIIQEQLQSGFPPTIYDVPMIAFR